MKHFCNIVAGSVSPSMHPWKVWHCARSSSSTTDTNPPLLAHVSEINSVRANYPDSTAEGLSSVSLCLVWLRGKHGIEFTLRRWGVHLSPNHDVNVVKSLLKHCGYFAWARTRDEARGHGLYFRFAAALAVVYLFYCQQNRTSILSTSPVHQPPKCLDMLSLME